ncbi:ParB N-terminal domain-containing protein [Streptomyces sp. RB17]|uniref:ParB N-terminal domain-containing protein n=1 Tax=Streptomyces sp. RB17 TaxID=2585197 RepID=UPI001886925D|nr:ParB N-terminal domain-containing protein [Streptomyces sp. RB17]
MRRAFNLTELVHGSKKTRVAMAGVMQVSEALELYSGDLLGLAVADTLDGKRQDDSYPDLLESIRLHGVQRPILVRRGELMDGHHRVAACLDLGITQVPFTDDFAIGWDR